MWKRICNFVGYYPKGPDIKSKEQPDDLVAPLPPEIKLDYYDLRRLDSDCIDIYKDKGDKWRFRIKAYNDGQGQDTREKIVDDIVYTALVLGKVNDDYIAELRKYLELS